MISTKYLVGRKFSRLIVLKDSGNRSRGRRIIWLCLCDCGNLTRVTTDDLKRGNTKSCGCLLWEVRSELGKRHTKGNLKHGDSKGVRLYRAWRNMICRCYYSKRRDYKYYGEIGIRVCGKWRKSYPPFKRWALKSGYRENLVIDRINSDGNYEPNNCQWITQAENARKSNMERKEKKEFRDEEMKVKAGYFDKEGL